MKLLELKFSEVLSIAIQIEERNFKIYRYLWLLLSDFNFEVSHICQKLSKQKRFQKKKLEKIFHELYSGVQSQLSLVDLEEDIEPLNIFDDHFDRFCPVQVLSVSIQIEKQAQYLYQNIARQTQEFKIRSLCNFFDASTNYHEKKIETMLEHFKGVGVELLLRKSGHMSYAINNSSN